MTSTFNQLDNIIKKIKKNKIIVAQIFEIILIVLITYIGKKSEIIKQKIYQSIKFLKIFLTTPP